MSADNWAVCPACFTRTQEKVNFLETALQKKYGKIPADQYLSELKQVADLQESLDNEDEHRTLREDFEIGIYQGKFEVDYRASCVCGFRFTYKYAQDPTQESS